MAENKFMERLRGKDTAKAVLEIQNTGSKTTFTKIPQSSSDATIVYPDSNHNATAVLKNAINWKVINGNLDLSNDVTGDGDDYVGYGFVQGISDAQGNNLWINSSYTVPAEGMVFTKNTKWILKLCGDNLLENGGTSVDFTVVITLGQSNIISKSFTVREQASFFCKEMVIDFTESNTSSIKLAASDKITLKLLSNSANASARIYHGMTTLTVLQRTVEAETVAFDSTTLEDLADTVSTHIADTNNPHSVTKAQVGLSNCDNTSDLDKPISTATQTALNGKVNIDGTSVMTGPLLMRATDDFKCAIAPYWDGIGFFKLNDNNSVTLMASLEYGDGLTPATDNTYNLGTATKRWKDARIARVITAVINNGYDIAVPVTNSADTLALKSEVDLAANSGRMITAQGVWYAKMYGMTVVPSSAEVEGRNYADFSQVDGQGNPIIVIYTYTSGAWDAGTTIVPPADYDGYVPITSKIWDIPEQAGQQGGRILWNHQSKEFTPYPQIISFENAALTGTPTAPTPTNASPNNQIATKEYVDNAGGANSNLSNLTSTGQNISNWSSNVTNCVTNIPQDIKLELQRYGTNDEYVRIILKAGSKVYIPDGLEQDGITPKYTLHTLDSDVGTNTQYPGTQPNNVEFFVCLNYHANTHNYAIYIGEKSYSGSTEPDTTYDNYGAIWYDQSTNRVKAKNHQSAGWYNGNYQTSLPIAKITGTGDTTYHLLSAKIDQVFNGFGYIGSTVFVLPGVKGMIPNSRNADGTLNNTECTISTVKTFYSNDTGKMLLEIGNELPWIVYETHSEYYTYDAENNYNLRNGSVINYCICAEFTRTSGAISNLKPKTVFHAVDYNDKEYIAHQAMPSDRYTDLTLGVSGATYTAPADGYVAFCKQSTGANQNVNIQANGMMEISWAAAPTLNLSVNMPVKKGDTFAVEYTTGGATQWFRFVYAQGAA